MNKNQKQLVLALLASGTLSAQAGTVIGMNIADTINTDTNGAVAGAPDGLGTDGKSGAFKFQPINLDTYSGVSLWNGNLNGGNINLAGGGPLSFSTGFLFTGSWFQPFNGVPDSGVLPQAVLPMPIMASTSAVADAAAVGTVLSGADLNINITGWAGYYSAANFIFNLTPDAGTLDVVNFIKTGQVGGTSTYAYRLAFSHYITSADDPTLTYTGFNARWVLEGTITAAVPEPETYAMMLAGLGLVGAAASRRRRAK